MATVSLTTALRDEYVRLFNDCRITATKAAEVDALVASLISSKARYEKVQMALGVPWHFVAVTHNMESSQRFDRHLHNGDPLTARTRQVPKDRPKTGAPPFTWEASAADAIQLKGLGASTDWTLAGTLYQIERYNGFGYRLKHPHVLSPYLWSYSAHYTSGKYVADGTWSDTAVSKQCGAAVLLRRMAENRQIEFTDQPTPQPTGNAKPLVVRYAKSMPTNPAAIQAAIDLQNWLNSFPGIFVKNDGWPGRRTSDAFRAVTGSYLPGDPKA